MKILSFNVNDDYRNNRQNALTLSVHIKNINPDIIGLQEVNQEMFEELNKHLKNHYFFSEKGNEPFFNVMLYKQSTEKRSTEKRSTEKQSILFSKRSFIHSSMGRHYIVLECHDSLYITTHLESGHVNWKIREKQIDEIFHNVDMNKRIVLFGDLNFTNANEKIERLNYLSVTNAQNEIYTYDSKFNQNATPPYRCNLDRFYSNDKIHSFTVEILKEISFSDHFPILLSF